jgi:ATP-binding cassette subfamily B protein
MTDGDCPAAVFCGAFQRAPAIESMKGGIRMARKENNPGLFRSLTNFMGECKAKMALSVVFSVLGVIFGILPFVGASLIISGLFEQKRNFQYYLICALAFGGGGALLKILFSFLSTALSHICAYSILKDLRLKVAKKLNRVPMGYLTSTPSGQIKKIVIDDTERLETPIAHMVPEVLGNILGSAASVAYLFVIDWKMALLSLISLPLGLVFYMGMMKDYKIRWAKYTKAAAAMNAAVVEYVGGIEVIKTFGRAGESYKKYIDAVQANTDATVDWQKSCRWWTAGAYAVWPSVLLFVLPLGLLLVLNDALSPSVLLSCAVLSLSIVGPIIGSLSYLDQFAAAATTIRNVQKILDEPEMSRPQEYAELTSNQIVLHNVGFAYDKNETLSDIGFSIGKGEITALVGPSGSGKSTIAKLIAGYWDVKSGQIEFMGRDLRQIPFKQLNEKIAYVAQDNFLFDQSIMDNIRMGKPDASEQEVIQAAKAADAHEFILNLPQGYATKVGDAGDKLTGGQRQRITIARAILKDAPVIILDESTAFADPENEIEIQKAISLLVADKTLLVVAHRLGTIRNADKIVVIDQGRIVGIGGHQHLVENCLTYRQMWDAYLAVEKGV